MSVAVRTRVDSCPGVLRPWAADDGLLVRIRLVAGEVTPAQLGALVEAARTFGDGRIHTTSRGNLQLRAFPDDGTGHLTGEASKAIIDTGLVPSPQHDQVRNIMASPLTGIDGGRTDLTGIAQALDEGIRASEALATLPGKFLFMLDDGRGDVLAHSCDLGLVALDGTTAQLRVGGGWGEVVPLEVAAERLLALAELFVERRGEGPEAPWHVAEMPEPLVLPVDADERVCPATGALPFVEGEGWRHVELDDQGIDGTALLELVDGAHRIRVTPWYGLVLVSGR